MAEKLPKSFIFGVATSAFQIEGGYNQPDGPKNNWFDWERNGKVEPSGEAARFWTNWLHYVELASKLGIDSFRISIEWSRIMPEENFIDAQAIKRYKEILQTIKEFSMQPLITLHHFCHPYRYGEDFWLRQDCAHIFSEWVKLAVDNFGDYCSTWITINEPNILPSGSYLFGIFPPGKIADLKSTLICYDNLLSAHIKSYEVIKTQDPKSVISTNVSSSSLYEFERMATDILLSKLFIENANEVPTFLQDKRHEFYTKLGRSNLLEHFLRFIYKAPLDLTQLFKETKKAMFSSSYEKFLDVIQIDFYNPWAYSHLRLPFHKTAGGRFLLPARALWDDLVDPESFLKFIEISYVNGLGLWVVENGLCNRVKNGRSFQRLDGWTRPMLFKHYLPKLIEARNRNINVTGYWHWSLMDNYEWGSYEPRFGIYGIDRQRDIKVLETDSMGYDAASSYKEMINSLRQ